MTQEAPEALTEAELVERDEIFAVLGQYPGICGSMHIQRKCIHCLRDKLSMKRRAEREKARLQTEWEREHPKPATATAIDGPHKGVVPGTQIDANGFTYFRGEVYRMTPDGLCHVPRMKLNKEKK